jgi:RimJ/RimL family protein N-acetyltransferase
MVLRTDQRIALWHGIDYGFAEGGGREIVVARLVPLREMDFDWLLHGSTPRLGGLTLPPGGVDAPSVLGVIRRVVQQLEQNDCRGAWMIVAEDEVVGLCSYKAPPVHGRAEIGYGIAASRRDRGHGTAAVGAVAEIARRDHGVRVLVGEVSIGNKPSARVLEKNGFCPAGHREDPEDGHLVVWELEL